MLTTAVLAAFLKAADVETATRAIEKAARELFLVPPFSIDGALSILESMTSEPGVLGVAARFGRARMVLAKQRPR